MFLNRNTQKQKCTNFLQFNLQISHSANKIMPTDILGVKKSEDPKAHMERKDSEINMRKKINGR